MTQRCLDLFAGPGGWDVYDEELGLVSDRVEIDDAARATAEAAGLHHVHDDVSTFKLGPDHGYSGLKASPPCQTFSAAGNGSGRRQLDTVIEHLYRLCDWFPLDYAHFNDSRTGLVLEPMRIILDSFDIAEPFRWIVLEQVPTVLPLWEQYAFVLRRLGYSVTVGNVQAEQYGVPQTRKRAVLVASLDREASLPEPTHSRFHNRTPERLDRDVKSWVSMAEALGWGLSERPSPTVTGGGADTGGAEPISHLARWYERSDWVQRSNYSSGGPEGATAEERGRTLRHLDQPSVTVTGKGFRWQQMGDVRSSRGTARDTGQPAPTITASADNGNFRWVPRDGDTKMQRVTVEEAAVLQTFPRDYPWRGNLGQQYQQVGNAIPPLLAKAILQQVV